MDAVVNIPGSSNTNGLDATSTPLSLIDRAKQEADSRLGLGATFVTNLEVGVDRKKGMFVCAPLTGETELRDCYQNIFQTTLDKKSNCACHTNV